MSSSIDIEALTIQKYLAWKPDALVYAIASLRFPTPSPVRKFGIIQDDLSATKEKVLEIINDKIGKHDFDKVIKDIIADPNPTQSGIGAIILQVFVGEGGILEYYIDASRNEAEVQWFESIAKEAYNMSRSLASKKKSEEETTKMQRLLKRLESKEDKAKIKKLTDFESDQEISELILALEDQLEQTGNEKKLEQWKKKKDQIYENYEKKIGTKMKQGSIDTKIEGMARDFTVNIIKKLWTESSRYEVVKRPQPKA